jgi:hypothetical protein
MSKATLVRCGLSSNDMAIPLNKPDEPRPVEQSTGPAHPAVRHVDDGVRHGITQVCNGRKPAAAEIYF